MAVNEDVAGLLVRGRDAIVARVPRRNYRLPSSGPWLNAKTIQRRKRSRRENRVRFRRDVGRWRKRPHARGSATRSLIGSDTGAVRTIETRPGTKPQKLLNTVSLDVIVCVPALNATPLTAARLMRRCCVRVILRNGVRPTFIGYQPISPSLF